MTVPVDLIVPAQLAPKAGRRGARLPRGHGKTAARKSDGVEGAVVDFDPFEITSLEEGDNRRIVVNVAEPAALLVAKTHKLGERLMAKDAGDVYRLFDATATADMSVLLDRLLARRPLGLGDGGSPRLPASPLRNTAEPQASWPTASGGSLPSTSTGRETSRRISDTGRTIATTRVRCSSAHSPTMAANASVVFGPFRGAPAA